MRWKIYLVVVALLVALGAVRFIDRPDSFSLLERPFPEFVLPALQDPAQTVGKEDFAGRVVLVNVWASWCLACREEHPLLVEVSRSSRAVVYGLNYRDRREDALRWLRFYGDPYVASAHDMAGEVGRLLGVNGVPQTFVVDRSGAIRYRHVGPLNEGVWTERIAPLLKKFEQPGV